MVLKVSPCYINSTRSDWLWAPYFLNYFESELFYRDGPITKSVSFVGARKIFRIGEQSLWVGFMDIAVLWIIKHLFQVNTHPPAFIIVKLIVIGKFRPISAHHKYCRLLCECIWISCISWLLMSLSYQIHCIINYVLLTPCNSKKVTFGKHYYSTW